MGRTKKMISDEKRRRERLLKEQGVPPVEIMTEEMRELAGLNRKYVADFSSGTAGLKIIDLKKAEKK